MKNCILEDRNLGADPHSRWAAIFLKGEGRESKRERRHRGRESNRCIVTVIIDYINITSVV